MLHGSDVCDVVIGYVRSADAQTNRCGKSKASLDYILNDFTTGQLLEYITLMDNNCKCYALESALED